MSDKRPSWTVRIDGEIQQRFITTCAEAGMMNKSLALERILQHMLRHDNIQITKSIIQSENN